MQTPLGVNKHGRGREGFYGLEVRRTKQNIAPLQEVSHNEETLN